MSVLSRIFLLILLVLCVLTPQTQAQDPLSVNSIRIGTHPDKTRIVIELSQKSEFRTFILDNPQRLVIDLPEFQWKAGNPSSPPGSLTKIIRNGYLQPGVARIVIDIAAGTSVQTAFSMPKSDTVPDRIVIDITDKNPVDRNKVYGTLETQSASTPVKKPPADSKGFLALPPRLQELEKIETPPKPKKDRADQDQKEAAVVLEDNTPVSSSKGGKPLIVIDPGHGGQDPGAIGANGTREKDVTLAAAKDLKAALEETGRYRVHLTRSKDVFIKLQDRVGIARKKGADLFISLHADSIDKPDVSGASIYTLSNKASDSQTAKLAARENRADLIAGVDLSHEDKEVAGILIDLAMRDTMNQSKFFANTIVKRASRGGVDLLEKPHRFAGFAVLKAPDIPSVLLEMGFMSNSRQVSQLSSPAYRRKIANAVVSGIDAYFAKVGKDSP